MKILCAVLTGVLASAPAQTAQAEEDARLTVLACLGQMEITTTWDQCRTVLFAPCADETVGSEPHLACLAAERVGWEAMMRARQQALLARLSQAGGIELAGLMEHWTGYVAQKCADVGAARAAISEEAAAVGCQISELAGLTLEFEACGLGRSTAPYCIFRDVE